MVSMTMSSSPGESKTGGSPSDPLQYCTLCGKPFALCKSARWYWDGLNKSPQANPQFYAKSDILQASRGLLPP
jgi:hypothetical protein